MHILQYYIQLLWQIVCVKFKSVYVAQKSLNKKVQINQTSKKKNGFSKQYNIVKAYYIKNTPRS